MNILIVRLGALGDIVHTIPAAAALRAAMPEARIDWIVDVEHQDVLRLVTGLDRVFILDARSWREWVAAVHILRAGRYDAALDFQGLMKSAVLARASAARRVAGFSIWHLREKSARPFYSETHNGAEGEHIIYKNLSLLRVLGIDSREIVFPLAPVISSAVARIRRDVGERPFAVINPGAAWPNKRWPAARYGEIAAFLAEVRGMPSVVLWGPGDEALAGQVVGASSGAAIAAPPTDVRDIVALAREAAIVVSGDTGPLHLAAAAGAAVVAIMGPTSPQRNGPWDPRDEVVSRFDGCRCHYQRRCHARAWCLESLGVPEVAAAIQQRLARVAPQTNAPPREGTGS